MATQVSNKTSGPQLREHKFTHLSSYLLGDRGTVNNLPRVAAQQSVHNREVNRRPMNRKSDAVCVRHHDTLAVLSFSLCIYNALCFCLTPQMCLTNKVDQPIDRSLGQSVTVAETGSSIFRSRDKSLPLPIITLLNPDPYCCSIFFTNLHIAAPVHR